MIPQLQTTKFRLLYAVIIGVIFTSPIFAPGSIMTLDSLSGPLIPTRILFFFANAVLLQKLLVVGIVFGSLIGLTLLLRRISFFSWLAALLFFIWNPFFIERIAIGQWYILLIGTLCIYLLIITDLLRKKINPYYLLIAIVLLIAMFSYPRSLNFIQIIVLAGLITWIFYGKHFSLLKRLGISVGVIIFILIIYNFLLLPHLNPGDVQVGIDELSLFSLGTGNSIDRIINVLSYTGFWAERADRLPSTTFQEWYYPLSGLFWLAIAGIGFIDQYRKERSVTVFLLVIYLLGLLVCCTNIGLISFDYLQRIYTTLGFVGLRETGKFMLLMLIPQTIFIAYGIQYLFKQKKLLITSIVCLGVCISLLISFIGTKKLISWSLTPIQYPNSLLVYANRINASNQTVILLPWHRFQGYSFTKGKIIDNPARYLFARYIYNEMLEYKNVITTSTSPWQQAMATVTTTSPFDEKEFLRLLQQRKVTIAIVMKTNDFHKYIAAFNKLGINPAFEDNEFIAFPINRD